MILTIFAAVTVVYGGWESLPKRNWENREPNRNICKSKHLSEGQERICRKHTDHMPHLNEASKQAVKWCQVQLTDNKWNCSAQSHRERDDIFGRIAKIDLLKTPKFKGSRESAFISAITSASLVHTMAKACRQSLDACGCSSNEHGQRRPPTLARNIEWNPCGDEFLYASKWAKQFTDIAANDHQREITTCLDKLKVNEPCETRKKTSSSSSRSGKSKQPTETKMLSKLARVDVNNRNNQVGRTATIQSKTLKCKCHGPSGSCQLKTCMWEMPPMEVVSDKLRSLYQNAQQMKWRKVRRRETATDKMIEIYPFKIDRKDRDAVPNGALLYITKSPNFCDKDLKRGILGTSGRKCSIDSNGQDGCDEMCCNRGYYIETQTKRTTCNCKFEWCCEVKCETCVEEFEQAYCHPSSSTSQQLTCTSSTYFLGFMFLLTQDI